MVVKSSEPLPPLVIIREAQHIPKAAARPPRLDCIDLLRGVVMVLMALDHTRDFFTGLRFAPEDLSSTSGPLFFTRFVTHFCAAAFFLLAGAGGYLSLARGKSLAQVSNFFWTRGLWLTVLDLTLIAYGWTFVFPFWFGGVLWALGWSMVIMALLIRLPLAWIATLGTGMIVTHNLLDGVDPHVFGKFGRLWVVLHGHGWVWIQPGKSALFVLWPLIPWVGVMAIGYALGALLQKDNWRKQFWRIGAVLTISFLVLRIFHLYGNGSPSLQTWAPDAAGPWLVQATRTLTIVSFFDTLKYPPSLQFLLMTVGPILMALAWFGKINAQQRLLRPLLVFGRVPLFYYVLHIYFIHSIAVWVAWVFHQPVAWLIFGGPTLVHPPDHYGHGLLFIYAMWVAVVALLYVPCAWFMTLKREHQDWWWLSYL